MVVAVLPEKTQRFVKISDAEVGVFHRRVDATDVPLCPTAKHDVRLRGVTSVRLCVLGTGVSTSPFRVEVLPFGARNSTPRNAASESAARRTQTESLL